MPKGQMTRKQERFVEEYLIDLNATQAAIRAGYSPSSANAIGGENLAKPIIKAAIDKAMAEQSRRTGINADRVIRELAKIAFLRADEVIDIDRAQVRQDAGADDLAAIAGVKVKYVPKKEINDDGEVVFVEAVEREIRFCDKLKALDMLAKHLGAYDGKKAEDGQAAETGIALMPPVAQLQPPEDSAEDSGNG